MKSSPFHFKTLLLPLAALLLYGLPATAQHGTAPAESKWVHYDSEGKLVYKTLSTGDRIMDFSFAGYMGGGVAIPVVPVKITLAPLRGDNTAAIQQAIDQVSRMPLQHGLRGAILLKPGTFNCGGTLKIAESGVVLSGSGTGPEGTILKMTGTPHLCISVGGHPEIEENGPTTKITDRYVASGSSRFDVADPSGFSVGDTIRITRPITDSWVAFMGMDKLVRNGKPETWIRGEILTERTITGITGSSVTTDVPLSDSYDQKYTAPGVTIQKISTTGGISQAGIENFSIVAEAQSGPISQKHDQGFSMHGMTDGWAQNIDIHNTVNSVSVTGDRITVEGVNITHDLPTTGAAKPADLNGSGHQILFSRCRITGDNVFYLATGAKVSGPIVLLDCIFKGTGWIQPHQRWATGLLVDNCQVPEGGIDFMNRGEYGSGHGLAVGWSVAWNSTAATLLNQRPPGSANWMIGCRGERQKKPMPFTKAPVLPEGICDSYRSPVTPRSLYLAQLSQRLGKEALSRIGY
jgi:hypothetical protein